MIIRLDLLTEHHSCYSSTHLYTGNANRLDTIPVLDVIRKIDEFVKMLQTYQRIPNTRAGRHQ